MANNNIFEDMIKPIFFTSIFIITYILFYNQIFSASGGMYPSDFPPHIGFINEVIAGKMYLPHPLFHYLTYYVSIIFGIDIKLAAILIAASLVTVLSIIVYKILLLNLSNKNTYFILFLVFVITFSGNFYLPGLNLTKFHYLGNGSISVWHNITLLLVKPLALTSFYLLFYYLDTKKIGMLLISLLMAILSIYAKPSFILIFLPTVFALLLFMYMQKLTINCILFYSISLLVSSGVILSNMYLNYTGTGASIVLAPFTVWNLYSNNITLSILISNLFVLSFMVLGFKHVSLKSWFSILMLVISILIFALFAESGPHLNHGNLGWSYLIAQPIAYLFVIIDFVNNYSTITPFKKNVLNTTLSLHLIGGVYYFIKIFMGLFYL